MTPILLFTTMLIYFAILFAVAYFVSKNSNNESFFIGNKNSNWLLVSFGMIGTSLSGVTFVSVPGDVSLNGFTYMQVVLGYLIGYFLIAFILLPIYYKLNVTSIYTYLQIKLGKESYKSGVILFIVSRTLGATARLYLVINILQIFVLNDLHINFYISAMVILGMIWLYTFKGGVKTIIYTDTLQTFCMLFGLVFCCVYILNVLHLDIISSFQLFKQKNIDTVFDTNPLSKTFFLKQILAGAFIAVTMTGMDQEMMQKNISVKKLKDAKKNMLTIGFMILIVTGLFLFLGGLLYLFGETNHIIAKADKLFPTIVLQYLPPFVSIIFIIALISALFPSADGAITSLTSSFCIDMLGFQNRNETASYNKTKIRKRVHFGFTLIFFIFLIFFKELNNANMINLILKIASFTYGPLLGLFSFAIFTNRKLNNKWVYFICLLAPSLCFVIDYYQYKFTYQFGLEILILNGIFTFVGLLIISKKNKI